MFVVPAGRLCCRLHCRQYRAASITYKEVEGGSLEANILYPPNRPSRGVVLFIHGGGLIFGNRRSWQTIPTEKRLVDRLLEEYTVVSPEYRLAPETKLSSIFEDIADACRWIRASGSKYGIDPSFSLACMGGSAGGFLALFSGLLPRDIRPQVVVSYYGYADLSWYSQPSLYYSIFDAIPEEEARRSVSSVPVFEEPPFSSRKLFYFYCRQNGVWLDNIFPASSKKPTEGEIRSFSPIFKMTSDFPPTFLAHGTDDKDVSCQEGTKIFERLQALSVPCEIHFLEGGKHFFTGAEEDELTELEDKTLLFLDKHLPVSD
jgi:acetyl esterase/lipase